MNKKVMFFLLLLTMSVYGGDVSRKGTTGAELLLIPVGATGIATGGSFAASITGLESIYYNPAGLSKSSGTEVMFNFMTYIADVNLAYFAMSTPIEGIGTVGMFFKTLDFGDIPITTTEFPDGTGINYSPSYMVIGLTYSKAITDRISIGANFKLINEQIINTSATGFAIDAGVQYELSKQLDLAVALKNIGGNMKYSGADLQQTTTIPGTANGSTEGNYEILTEEFQIPSYFEMSLAYKINVSNENKIILASTYTANNALEDVVSVGAEFGYLNTFFLRGGYKYQVENSSDYLYSYSVGAGVNYELVDGLSLKVDYAYRDVAEFAENNHVFSIILGF